uniref:Copia protein n=2 Tax=Cacopsylla melanoneura TaxID=428564 RepID=A0A8D9ARJ7_9HEMI
MEKESFVNSKHDTCLYVKISKDSILYVLLYVDDIILVGNNEVSLGYFKSKLTSEFEMVSLDNINYLGLIVERNKDTGEMKIHQNKYLGQVLTRFDMKDCKTISTPIEKGLHLAKASSEEEKTDKPFRELVGSLMYLMIGSRPDICYALNFFCKYQDQATNECFNHLKRILRYLNQTKVLVYTKEECETLYGFVDADWANDKDDRKSISGYCYFVYGNLVSWCTRKQSLVSLSSTEAEYIACSVATCEALWLKGILLDLSIEIDHVPLYEDNQSAIHMAKNRENGKRTKHVDIKYHFIRDEVEKGNVILKYVPTDKQVADMFTKSLSYPVFQKFLKDLGIV